VFGAQRSGLRSRFLDEIPGELLDEPDALTAGALALESTAGHARPGSTALRGGLDGSWADSRAGATAALSFRLGEDVVHAAFGEGVVTGVEPDGVIVVRFAGDGSERKLVAEYAPVSRR